MSNIDLNAQRAGAKELVIRARTGDQNAVAMIEQARKNSEAGDEVARSAIACIIEFIKLNPVRDPTMIAGADDILGVLKGPNDIDVKLEALKALPTVGDSSDVCAACVILSFGPPITRDTISGLTTEMTPEEKNAFLYGVQNAKVDSKGIPPVLMGFVCAGHCIGTARKMQLVKANKVSPGIFGKDVAWEHT